jgi:hypothetical protein
MRLLTTEAQRHREEMGMRFCHPKHSEESRYPGTGPKAESLAVLGVKKSAYVTNLSVPL